MAPNNIIAIDLDETIVFSDEMKAVAWSVILKDFGFCWTKDEERSGLIYVPDNLRPPPGTSPHDFISLLIDNLTLFNGEAHDKEQLISRLQEIWTVSLIEETKRRAEKGEIIEVPGAAEFITKLRQNGWKIAVVTQAPFEYALTVLQSLGLVDDTFSHEDDKLLMMGNNQVDVIVSGEMVEKPKPDPEPLLRAAFLVDFKSKLHLDSHMICIMICSRLSGKSQPIVN